MHIQWVDKPVRQQKLWQQIHLATYLVTYCRTTSW